MTTPKIPKNPKTLESRLEVLLKKHLAEQAAEREASDRRHKELLAAVNRLSAPKDFYPQNPPPVFVKGDILDTTILKFQPPGTVTAQQDPPLKRWPDESHFGAPKKTADIINSVWRDGQRKQ